MSNQRKIIFLHLPKTAGTSLVNILHQHYQWENSADIAGDDLASLSQAIAAEKPFIHGHFSNQILQAVKGSGYLSASLLRQASDRVISRYVHMAHSKEQRLQGEFASYGSFEDFLDSSYADNWQCRMLAGIWHDGKVDQQTFEKALETLHQLDWVATADDLPEAALDLSLKLGFKNRYYPKLNERRSEQMWQELNGKYRSAIAELNHFDQRLVEEAAKLYQINKRIPLLAKLRLALMDS